MVPVAGGGDTQHIHNKSKDIATYILNLPRGKPALTLGILISIFSFQVEFVDQFKLMEELFMLVFWQYKAEPLAVGEGLGLILINTCNISDLNNSISCL